LFLVIVAKKYVRESQGPAHSFTLQEGTTRLLPRTYIQTDPGNITLNRGDMVVDVRNGGINNDVDGITLFGNVTNAGAKLSVLVRSSSLTIVGTFIQLQHGTTEIR